MRVTVLGSGASGGVPLVGGVWGACDPANPRNRRLRPSLLVEGAGASILIDTSPDLRAQLLASAVGRLDAVLYTHAHADHVHGIDDLRALNFATGAAIPAYGSAKTLAEIADRFGYAFIKSAPPQKPGWTRPELTPHVITGPFQIAGLEIVPFDQDHHVTISTGFRIGRFAYSTDVVRLDEAAFATLAGIEVWVVSCLREEPHPIHAHLEWVLGWIERLRPQRAILTHMNHSLDYATLARKLPPGVEPGYDGLVLEV
ncbi:MAG: MBL fold metallo-hydrolase [Alphaproteobacteria bacterium]|nr:MBL fold metallo-hydrolase [Alphaproteobacteria bacterium]